MPRALTRGKTDSCHSLEVPLESLTQVLYTFYYLLWGHLLDLTEKKKKIEYFSFWRLQNKITLFSLIAILVLSAFFSIASLTLPQLTTSQLIAFIILIPALACFGIATCHSSNLESAKALSEYKRLLTRLGQTENSQITLDRFFSISTDLMAVAGRDGYLKKASTSLVNTLGYSEETLLSTPFFDFIHPDDRELTKQNIESLYLGLRSVGFQNRYRKADGTYRALSWSAAADKELGVRFASARDVTDERNFHARMQQIMDSAPFLLLVKNIDGTITSCNTAFAQTLGVSQESLLGKDAHAVLPLDLISTDREQSVLNTQTPLSFDERILKEDHVVKLRSTVFPILDQDGVVVALGKISLKSETPC